MTERYAIYYAPERETPLWRFGTSWLGRDPETGEGLVARFGLSEELHARVVDTPAHYGFHGTLKPPFRLAADTGVSDLRDALKAFVATRQAFVLPQLHLGELGGFLALLPEGNSTALAGLAADCVTALDRFRAPLTDAEIARRNPDRLEPGQRANLERWGYPYVLDAFRFHMTLTGRLAPDELSRIRPVLDRASAELVREPVQVSSVALFHEPGPSEPFRLAGRYRFGGPASNALYGVGSLSVSLSKVFGAALGKRRSAWCGRARHKADGVSFHERVS